MIPAKIISPQCPLKDLKYISVAKGEGCTGRISARGLEVPSVHIEKPRVDIRPVLSRASTVNKSENDFN